MTVMKIQSNRAHLVLSRTCEASHKANRPDFSIPLNTSFGDDNKLLTLESAFETAAVEEDPFFSTMPRLMLEHPWTVWPHFKTPVERQSLPVKLPLKVIYTTYGLYVPLGMTSTILVESSKSV
jgi:hypothetical protein